MKIVRIKLIRVFRRNFYFTCWCWMCKNHIFPFSLSNICQKSHINFYLNKIFFPIFFLLHFSDALQMKISFVFKTQYVRVCKHKNVKKNAANKNKWKRSILVRWQNFISFHAIFLLFNSKKCIGNSFKQKQSYNEYWTSAVQAHNRKQFNLFPWFHFSFY